MAYRDDRQALSLQVADLERENAELKSELAELRDDAKRDREVERERAKRDSRHGCVMCGGRMHAVAVFSGRHDAPKSLQMSTSRFSDPSGGFSRSTPIKAMACSSCGFIHHYIDLEGADKALVTGHDEDGFEDDEGGHDGADLELGED
ncbi:MAG: hypothetical protein KUG77_06585 [Nannocystaceae bacterium]|nr:hypothetical protein [Nannocystaceae bacterium]